ncbi:MAG: tetratricopeptide repeat protein [Deltaproteobacteria bacterium]|nr:tetratricopeptide repeat protein [Deltaproteobacteria bacterium]
MSRRASSLAGTGDWDGAAAVWLEILGLNPEHGPSLYNLGLYHERRGDLDKAFAYYRLAFLSSQIRPYRLALTRISDTLEKLGRLPQAAPPRPF